MAAVDKSGYTTRDARGIAHFPVGGTDASAPGDYPLAHGGSPTLILAKPL